MTALLPAMLDDDLTTTRQLSHAKPAPQLAILFEMLVVVMMLAPSASDAGYGEFSFETLYNETPYGAGATTFP
jgi:hypothetical protein